MLTRNYTEVVHSDSLIILILYHMIAGFDSISYREPSLELNLLQPISQMELRLVWGYFIEYRPYIWISDAMFDLESTFS